MGVAGKRFAPSVHLGGLRCLILTPQMSSKHRGVIWGVLFSMPSEAAPALFPTRKSSSLARERSLSSSGREMCVEGFEALSHTPALPGWSEHPHLPPLGLTELSGTAAVSAGSCCVWGSGLGCWWVTLLWEKRNPCAECLKSFKCCRWGFRG